MTLPNPHAEQRALKELRAATVVTMLSARQRDRVKGLPDRVRVIWLGDYDINKRMADCLVRFGILAGRGDFTREVTSLGVDVQHRLNEDQS